MCLITSLFNVIIAKINTVYNYFLLWKSDRKIKVIKANENT